MAHHDQNLSIWKVIPYPALPIRGVTQVTYAGTGSFGRSRSTALMSEDEAGAEGRERREGVAREGMP